LKKLNLKDYEYNVKKIVSKIKDLIATLDDNAVHLRSDISEILDSVYNDDLCEDYMLHIKMYKIDYHKGRKIDVVSMLIDIEKKYSNLFRKKKWVSPADSNSSSKYMSLLSTKQNQSNQFALALQKILLSSEGESLRKTLLA